MPRSTSDEAGLRVAIEAMLRACGLDPSTDGDLIHTPERVARLWQREFLTGYGMDPAAILGDPVVGEKDPDVVVVAGLRFHAMCPHHLLPYRGQAHVAYIPRGKLAGFGRLADLVDCHTRRLTLQERATHQIADALWRGLGAAGAGCVMEAEQMCLSIPGEKHDEAAVVTSAFVGEMSERPDIKSRLLAGVGSGRISG